MTNNRKQRRKNLSKQRKVRRAAEREHFVRSPDEIIYSPETLSLDGNKESLEFFSKVRSIADGVHGSNKFMLVDLVNTKRLDLGAALVLVAEFDRWQRLRSTTLVPRTVAQWDPSVRDELNALGFFRLLKTNLPSALRRTKTKAWIQFVTDTLTIGRAALLLRKRLESELSGSTGYDEQIYIVLIEAMKNALQHAYPDETVTAVVDKRMGKRWWMAAAIDDQKKSIEVAFLDLGITIPRSLPTSWLWSYLSPSARLGSDSVQILEAMSYGASRTNQAHRGKGFSNIIRPTGLHSQNFLSVLSGKGLCIVGHTDYVAIETNEPLQGTLIRWRLNLHEENEERTSFV